MDIKKISALSGINESNIINCYVCGSRLSKNHHESSDYDIMMIADNVDMMLCKYVTDNNISYDIHIFSIEYFYKNMISPECLIFLEFPWIPREFVIKELATAEFTATKSAVVKCLDTVVDFNKMMITGDMPRVRKNKYVGFNIKYATYVLQILKNGRITDYSENMDIINDVKFTQADDYPKYDEIYESLRESIEELL